MVKRVTERSTGAAYAVKIMSLPPAGAEPSDNESTRCAACFPFGRLHAPALVRGGSEARGGGQRTVQEGVGAPPAVMTQQSIMNAIIPYCSEDIFKEIDILCGLDHENVVALKEYFEEGNKVGGGGGVYNVQHVYVVSCMCMWTRVYVCDGVCLAALKEYCEGNTVGCDLCGAY